jgi:hypothetical protein
MKHRWYPDEDLDGAAVCILCGQYENLSSPNCPGDFDATPIEDVDVFEERF